MNAESFNLYDLLERNARIYRDRNALIQGDRIRSHGELLERVNALAAGLEDLQLEPGARVCILAQNDAAYLELYGACARQGLAAYPINWRLSAEEVARVLTRARPAVMVVDAACADLAHPGTANGASGAISHWLSMGTQPVEGMPSLEALYLNTPPKGRPVVEAQDPFVVISTAAVDAIPRGAILSHGNIIAGNMQSMYMLGLGPDDVNLVALPLFHIAALGMTLATLHAGGCNVVMPRYDAAEAVRLIGQHNITHISDFPPVLENLLNAAKEAGAGLGSLRHVSGLENPATIERLEQETSARFWTGFGQSETSGFVTLQRYADKPGAAGLPGPLAEVRVMDATGNEVPQGDEGEIVVRGPCVFKGYFDQPEVTAHTLRGGWHHTGDVGRFDEAGYLIYVRRMPEKELIKSGGENVYPAEVEAVIAELAAVQGVCVFGVPDAQWGEAVRAVVEGVGLEERDVISHVEGRIARFKRPRVVRFTDALPRNEGGEVDREEVKKRWSD